MKWSLSHLFWVLLVLVSCTSCTFKKAVLFPNSHGGPLPIRDQYVILINMDGTRPPVLEAVVQQGHLPTIKKLFFEEGARIEKAITVFPTVSIPAHQAFISGLHPGHHGVPALDWFSRPLKIHFDYLLPQDISKTNYLLFNFKQVQQDQITTDAPQLLFTLLEGHPTMSVFETLNHGVSLRLPKNPPLVTAYRSRVRKAWEQLDQLAIHLTLKYFRELPFEQIPRFTFVSLFGMDQTNHFAGPDSDRVADLLIHYDRFLAELVRILKNRGIWDKTTLVLVSDHGQHYLKDTVDLPGLLHKIGLNTNRVQLNDRQVVWGDHGTGTLDLYLKVGKNWENRPTYAQLRDFPLKEGKNIDLVQTLLDEPDIEMILAPEGPWRTHVHFENQHAVIERRLEGGQTLYAYLPDPGEDPIGYLKNPTIKKWVEKGEFHDAESWLQESYDLTMPDVVVSVPQLFDDYRAGDLLVLTIKEKQFKEEKLAGHGSLYAEDRVVILMFHGPDIQPGIYPTARILDVYPTLLAIFGISSPGPMDGVLRKEILKPQFSYSPKVLPQTSSKAMSLTEFRDALLKKLEKENLTIEEKNKVRQLLYTTGEYIKEREKYAMPGENQKTKYGRR